MKPLWTAALAVALISSASAQSGQMQKWEYARLDVNFASAVTSFDARYWVGWSESREGKETRRVMFKSWEPNDVKTLEEFVVKVANYTSPYLTRLEFEYSPFQSALGALGWEMVSIIKEPEKKISLLPAKRNV